MGLVLSLLSSILGPRQPFLHMNFCSLAHKSWLHLPHQQLPPYVGRVCYLVGADSPNGHSGTLWNTPAASSTWLILVIDTEMQESTSPQPDDQGRQEELADWNLLNLVILLLFNKFRHCGKAQTCSPTAHLMTGAQPRDSYFKKEGLEK